MVGLHVIGELRADDQIRVIPRGPMVEREVPGAPRVIRQENAAVVAEEGAQLSAPCGLESGRTRTLPCSPPVPEPHAPWAVDRLVGTTGLPADLAGLHLWPPESTSERSNRLTTSAIRSTPLPFVSATAAHVERCSTSRPGGGAPPWRVQPLPGGEPPRPGSPLRREQGGTPPCLGSHACSRCSLRRSNCARRVTIHSMTSFGRSLLLSASSAMRAAASRVRRFPAI